MAGNIIIIIITIISIFERMEILAKLESHSSAIPW